MNTIDQAVIAKIVSLVVAEVQRSAAPSPVATTAQVAEKTPRKRGRSTRKAGEKSNQPILFTVTETELAQIRQWVASSKRRPRAEMIREAIFKQIAATVK